MGYVDPDQPCAGHRADQGLHVLNYLEAYHVNA